MLASSIFGTGKKGDLVLGRKGKYRLSPVYRLPLKDRSAHMYVVGLSGKGKSKFLEHCLVQDIVGGRGCGLIDPHSLLADDIFRNLLTSGNLNDEISDRIIYVDPARDDYVVPFNVLLSSDKPYDIAISILEAFRRTWPDSLREAPHFSNVATAALIVLIENGLTLMDMHRLLTNDEFRNECLTRVSEPSVIEFFRDRYERWGREAPMMRESTLNKVGAFSLNPRLKMMLGQTENHLDFQKIMDDEKILIMDLGRADGETNRLIGSLVTTGLERAMRRRRRDNLWSLTIDEFAGYVANEGSAKTLSHVFSEGRKFRMSMTVAHQDLSQLTPRMLGALSNVQTKVIFGVGREDAEYFSKLIGRVDAESVKRQPKTETQHEMFESLPEQWEQWIDQLRFQAPRQAMVSNQAGDVSSIRTITIPPYSVGDEEVEELRRASLKRHAIPYGKALRNVEERERNFGAGNLRGERIPSYGS